MKTLFEEHDNKTLVRVETDTPPGSTTRWLRIRTGAFVFDAPLRGGEKVNSMADGLRIAAACIEAARKESA
jgi:hypothetical protein